MTKPTQAQIEAAAREISDALDYEQGPDDWSRQVAKAALTAAAEVGDRRWQDVANQGIHIEAQLRKELLTIEAATIERCAELTEKCAEDASANSFYMKAATEIAAAIRALKDKP